MAIDCNEQNFHIKSLHDTSKADKNYSKWSNARYGNGENQCGDQLNTLLKFILVIVFLCIPLMLLVKPIYEIKKHSGHHADQNHNHRMHENTYISEGNESSNDG